MRHAKGTFCLEHLTLKRLQEFSRRSGIPQSAIVDQIVSRGLTHLESNWRTPDQILDDAFALGKQRESIKNGTPSSQKLLKGKRV